MAEQIITALGTITTDLTYSVMRRVADRLDLDIYNKDVENGLYWVCCDLESWPEGEGFGSSDHYGYMQSARRVFHIPADA